MQRRDSNRGTDRGKIAIPPSAIEDEAVVRVQDKPPWTRTGPQASFQALKPVALPELKPIEERRVWLCNGLLGLLYWSRAIVG
ncbi:hypothetical protein TWF281_005396 [Arthrobotrys megalospora]